jgi:hypothetical protein
MGVLVDDLLRGVLNRLQDAVTNTRDDIGVNDNTGKASSKCASSSRCPAAH